MEPPRRRGRRLSGEEARLWGEIAKLITPLRGRAVPAKPRETPDATPPRQAHMRPPLREGDRASVQMPPEGAQPSPERATASPAPVGTPSKKRRLKLGDLPLPGPPRPAAPPFKPSAAPPGLERRERQKLQRGILPIEARIDLHGLYQAEAHAALVGFLMQARASGLARVLVVTGKGAEPGESFSERGVLRRSVPHWLRGPDLRAIVLGFEEAGRQHGGAGALYVRLRRR